MKKWMILLLVTIMIASTGLYVYADTVDTICDLDPEVWEELLSIKKEFLDEKVANGDLTQEEADEIYAGLESRTGFGLMRGLGFGFWFRNHEEFDKYYELMQESGCGQGGNGYKQGGNGFGGKGRGCGRSNQN